MDENKEINNKKILEENIDKVEKVKKEKKHSKFTKKIMLFIGAIVLIIVAISFMRVHNENRLTITTKSSLEKIIEINKLSTI